MIKREEDKTALSYWFPLLHAAGIPVPKTTISLMPVAAQQCIWAGMDGKEGDEPAALPAFIEHLKLMAQQVGGYPCFLRTDHTSGKHSWDRTCFVKSADDLLNHVFALAEHSELCDMIGLPWDTWVVREYLPIIPIAHCPRYINMPVCREFRFFVDDGAIRCVHPYWPIEALEEGDAQADADVDAIYAELSKAPADILEISALACQAGAAVGGSWSIDILETERGWFVTDMAEAHKSFHWVGCAHADGEPKCS
jgi:hypothetical protein